MLEEGIGQTVGMFLSGRAAEVVTFFLYDSIKILFILYLMILAIGVLRTYVPQEKVRKLLSKKKGGAGYFMASFFGAITPFCSCSSIPLFLGFMQSGVPLGVTFSFLITSPLVNQYLVAIMLGEFGWKITLAYVVIGVGIGVVAGWILGKMGLEKYLVKDVKRGKKASEQKFDDFKSRMRFGLDEAWTTTKKLWVWVLVGVGIGAAIHNLIPDQTIQNVIAAGGIFAVPLAVIVGVPVYGSCAAIVPIALVLFEKGVPIGTALAFMMAVSALSLPEAIILRRALKLKLIAIYFGVVAVGIVFSGYLLNLASSMF